MDERFYVHAVGGNNGNYRLVMRLRKRRNHSGVMTFYIVPAEWPAPQSHADAARYYALLSMAQAMRGYLDENGWSVPDRTGRVYNAFGTPGGLRAYAEILRNANA